MRKEEELSKGNRGNRSYSKQELSLDLGIMLEQVLGSGGRVGAKSGARDEAESRS